ncbi:MAG: methyltransferase domain-containing protein [Syntrophobacteraceae bacterium]
MKKHIRQFYEQRYLAGGGGAGRLGGKPLAVELGYPPGLLDLLPSEVWEDFLPCGNVLSRIDPGEGDRVLNLGCGAGVDSLLLKLSPHAAFSVINLDNVFPVLVTARKAAQSLPFSKNAVSPPFLKDAVSPPFSKDSVFPPFVKGGQGGFAVHGLEFLCADGAALPFAPGSFRWIILNGVFNLFPEKAELIEEMHRVLTPGGIVAGADLCRKAALPDYFASEPDAWAWCMNGALTREELIEGFEAAGFSKRELVTETMDEFFDRAVFVFAGTA